MPFVANKDDVLVEEPAFGAGDAIIEDAAEGAVAIKEPLESDEAFDRAGKAWDFSVETELPVQDVEQNYPQLIAAPGESRISELFQRYIRDPITEKTGLFPYVTDFGDPRRSELTVSEKLSELKTQFPAAVAHIAAERISGIGLSAPDILAQEFDRYVLDSEKPVTTLAELVGKITDLQDKGEFEQAAQITGQMVKFFGGLKTARKLLGPIMNRLPVRESLRFMFAAGIEFGAVTTSEELSLAITEGKEVDWGKIRKDAGWGTLFGGVESLVGKLIQYKDVNQAIKFEPRLKNVPRNLLNRVSEAGRARAGGMTKKAWLKVYGEDMKQFVDHVREIAETPLLPAKAAVAPAPTKPPVKVGVPVKAPTKAPTEVVVAKVPEKGIAVPPKAAEAKPVAPVKIGKEVKPPRNLAEARDRSATEWAQNLADTIEPSQEIFIPPQVNRIFTFRGKEKSTLIQTGDHLRAAGLIPGSELNRWQKPEAEAPVAPKPPIKKKAAVPPEPRVRDVLGGVDPLVQIHQALREAKAVQPLTKAQKAAELRRRVGAAAGALKSNVKRGTPTEESIFKSTGLLKGPLTEYDQLYTSIEDIIEPGAKESGYAKIYAHPGLSYFEVLNTATSFKKLLAGTAMTPTDIRNIENVFGKTFADITKDRQVKSDLYDRIITIWKAGLLTGIKTSGLNTLSNVSHAMTETAKDIPAALVDRTAALFTGDRTLAFTVKGTGKGINEGLKKGWTYLSTGYDERHIGEKLDYKAVYFGKSKVAKSLQVYEETIFHLLGAEDQPFYYGAKARSLYSQAVAKAINKGLKGKERSSFVKNLVGNPTDDMLIAATHDAEVAVFQNRTTFGDIARSVQKVKGGEIVIPFGRTPSAVAMQIINYSPVGAVKEVAQQINSGEFNQRKFSQAFGRAAIGTGALFIGGLLLKAGLMTLDHPKTEKERELWKLEGRKANSIKIGDKWRSIQVLGPVGNVLIVGGHFERQLKEEGSPTKAIVTAMAGGAKSFSEQTFVRGVNQAVDALAAPERSFENWFSSMAGSAVPTIVADIARAEDITGRRAVGPVQRVQARIPIARKGLPPAVDVFGQDLPRYGGNVLETMADPSRPAKIRHDIVVDELRRLFDKDIRVSPTKLGDREGYDILTPEENTRLWRRAGELTYKALLALVNSDRYKAVDNDFAKGKAIESLVSKTKAAAKAEMVSIKINQGVSIIELAESGLLSIEGLDALKYFGESNRTKE